MSTPIDGKLMDLFVEETQGMIAALRGGLATLAGKGGPEDAAAILKGLVRHAHTIAGSSGMAGFDDLQELAHGLEQALRKSQDTGDVEADRLQSLSETIDACERLLGGEKIDTSAALRRLTGGEA